jgi:serine/threonine protein phosphatase 1
MRHTSRVLRLPQNTQGRDFVVGDIHGCFSVLDRALARAEFDPAKDRLIVVGDLVDRGPESDQVLEFLRRPSIYSIRGNHDDVIQYLLGSAQNLTGQDEMFYAQFLAAASMDWRNHLPAGKAELIRAAFEELPTVIEVETDKHPNHADAVRHRLTNENAEACRRALISNGGERILSGTDTLVPKP